jgi:hypothetical protein
VFPRPFTPGFGEEDPRMRSLLTVAVVLWSTLALAFPQGDSFTRNFKAYKEIAKDIDFYAAAREQVTPFEKPVREARQRLALFLGTDLTRGAVVICSSLEQRDSVNEAKVLRMGYKWVIIQLTPEATTQDILARMKAQMGGQVPPGVLDRMRNQTPEMKTAALTRLVANTVQRVGYAILTTTSAPDKPFRSSRADDVARSPLADWLDVGIVAYGAGGPAPNLRLLQERIEEAFPIEDVIVMSRPFVVPGTEGGGGGGGGNMVFTRAGAGGGQGAQPSGAGAGQGAPGGAGAQVATMTVTGGQAGGSGPGGGGGGGRGGRNAMPKDVQDRMMFDAQAASLFSYIIEKGGIEKVKALVQASQEKKDLREMLIRPDFLGTDMEKLESDWQAWVKAQKGDPGMRMMFTAPGNRPPGAPQNN